MKKINIYPLIFILFASLLSCKKGGDGDKMVDYNEEFKGSAWAGEFRYTTGYNGLQPFSIVLKGDGTLTWSDLGSTRPGGTWLATGSTVVITFPSLVKVQADITKDTWTNFSNTLSDGFQIANLVKSEVPNVSKLANTIWSGTYFTYSLKIKILPLSNIELYRDGTRIVAAPYTIEGAGIRFTQSVTGKSENYYGVFTDAATIKGYGSVATTGTPFYPIWNGKKE